MNYIRNGDMLVISELSRMSRSLSHLLEIVEDLKSRRVDLKSFATGSAFLSIRGAISKMEQKSNQNELKRVVLQPKLEENLVVGLELIQIS